jgi:hypothetical protein
MCFYFAGICWLLTSALYAQVAQDQWFNSNGVQIRYIEQGSGEPVLLIHGYTASIETNWINTGVFQNLAKDHRVVALTCEVMERVENRTTPPRMPGKWYKTLYDCWTISKFLAPM